MGRWPFGLSLRTGVSQSAGTPRFLTSKTPASSSASVRLSFLGSSRVILSTRNLAVNCESLAPPSPTR